MLEQTFGDLETAGLGRLTDEDKDKMLLLSLRHAQMTAQQLINYDAWREEVSGQLKSLNEGVNAIMAAHEAQAGTIEAFDRWREDYVADRERREAERAAATEAASPPLPAWAKVVPVIGPVFARFADSKKPLALGLGWAVAIFATLLSWWLFIDDGVLQILRAVFGHPSPPIP